MKQYLMVLSSDMPYRYQYAQGYSMVPGNCNCKIVQYGMVLHTVRFNLPTANNLLLFESMRTFSMMGLK